MKKVMFILNIVIMVLGVISCAILSSSFNVVVKTVASSHFLILGIVNVTYNLVNKSPKKAFSLLLAVGLFFGFVADVVLEFEFIIGAALFAVAHIFFFTSYCMLSKFRWKDLLYASFMFVPILAILLFVPILNYGSILMQMVCVFYALIISCMVGKSISNFTLQKSTLTLLILIGSSLFAFSDLMLLFNNFANISSIFLILCLTTYYPAELILGHSLLYINKTKEKNMKQVTAVAGVITNEKGEILCTLRDKGKYDYVSYKWEFPGGKLEAGETNEQALVRELHEELEIDVKVEGFCYQIEHDYPDFHLSMAVYNCKLLSNSLKVNVHKDIKWLPKSELLTLDWAPADIPAVLSILK